MNIFVWILPLEQLGFDKLKVAKLLPFLIITSFVTNVTTKLQSVYIVSKTILTSSNTVVGWPILFTIVKDKVLPLICCLIDIFGASETKISIKPNDLSLRLLNTLLKIILKLLKFCFSIFWLIE